MIKVAATTTIMASYITIITPTTCMYSSSTTAKPVTHNKVPRFQVSKTNSNLGLTVFSQWSGLKHLGVSVTPRLLSKERKRKFRGVKVARNLGKTLRAFQPTIRELQDVSREFKSTLEKEIGLDDISSSTQRTYSSERFNAAQGPSSTVSTKNSVNPNGVGSPNSAYTSEEYLKITEEQLKSPATIQQEQKANVEESKPEPQNQPQVTTKGNADTAVPGPERTENET